MTELRNGLGTETATLLLYDNTYKTNAKTFKLNFLDKTIFVRFGVVTIVTRSAIDECVHTADKTILDLQNYQKYKYKFKISRKIT